MSDLFASLNSAASALRAFEQSIDVVQNNVSNASTPGYAKQNPVLQSLPFQLDSGLTGGVRAQAPQSSRNSFAESAVQTQTSLLGTFSQITTSLQSVEGVFDVSGNSGIPQALNQLYAAFSAWSSQPDSVDARTSVITAAQQAGVAFQQAASQLDTARSGADKDLQSTVAQINQIASDIRDYNVARSRLGAPDAGLDAKLNSSLESLSSLADIQVSYAPDGTATVLLGGQTPLVIGDKVDVLKIASAAVDNPSNPDAPPNAAIVDSNGTDITGQISNGQLKGLLTVRNEVLPSLLGSPTATGDLNTLARSFADAVNGLLSSGSVSASGPAQPGAPLFTYGTGTNTAATLSVNKAITPDQLAAVDPGPPLVANGIATALASLDSDPTHQVNGLSYSQFFSSLATNIGSRISTAQSGSDVQTQVVASAQAARQQISGVSLDEEAVRLLELQRSYQAASQMVSVVNAMAQSLLDMLR